MLTEKELILLNNLRENSRKSLAKISEETEIPTSTLFNTLKRLESEVIVRHVSMIDFSKIGFSFRVCFAISSKQKQELKDFLMNHSNIFIASGKFNHSMRFHSRPHVLSGTMLLCLSPMHLQIQGRY